MRIAMIGHKRVPSREGGIEIVVEELSVRLAAMGHQVDCYNRWEIFNRHGVKLPKEYKGIRLIRIPTWKHQALNAFVYSVLAVVRALFTGCDVIHLHAEGPCAMAFLPKLLGIPVVATIHGLDWQRAKWGGFAKRYLQWGEKNAAKYSDVLFVLSEGNRRYFKNRYGRDTVLIPNGVEIKPYREPEEIGRLWNLKRDDYILYLGRLVPEKGLHYLIEAFKKTDTDKRLLIAGELDRGNAYVKEICRMAEEDQRIATVGFVQGQILEELLSNCFLFVLPSDVEGMSISLLDALSYGVKCLVSDIEENVEITGEFAASFPRGNVTLLQKRLEEQLSATWTKEDRARQIAYVKDHFNWDETALEMAARYESVIQKRKRGEAV